jgi:geranylgeranyl diphosphate synthase type II
MEAVRSLQEEITAAIEELKFPEYPSELYDPIRYTLQLGGKRMRPVLCVLGSLVCGGKITDALKPAMGIELFHNFTLLHDDIMDNAPLRRNKPTVFSKWNTNVAILSGDVMFAEAFRLISEAPPAALKRVIDCFIKASVEVCEGQQLDMDFELRNDVSIESYLEMIRMKTAVLLGASLEIGALCSGADAETASRLYSFGTQLGIAFQLHDDLLDVYGNPDKFGKRVGGDIVSNKKTFLKLKAMEKADGSTKNELNFWYSGQKHDEGEKVEAVRSIFNTLNIRQETEARMDQYFVSASSFLEHGSFKNDYKQHLLQLAGALMQRES